MSRKLLTVVYGDDVLEGMVKSLEDHKFKMEDRKKFIIKMLKDFEAEQENYHKNWWKKLQDHLVHRKLLTLKQKDEVALSLSEGMDVIFYEDKNDLVHRETSPLVRMIEHIFS